MSLRDFLGRLGALLILPVGLILFLVCYGNFLTTISMIASWASMYLFHSVQNEFTPLFWIALSVAIANTGLIYLKSWMAKKKGVVHDDLGSTPVSWGNTLLVIQSLTTVAGIGLFVYAIVMKF